MTLKAVFIIPWLFRYGISYAMRRDFQDLKNGYECGILVYLAD